jgi:hypothetical protein
MYAKFVDVKLSNIVPCSTTSLITSCESVELASPRLAPFAPASASLAAVSLPCSRSCCVPVTQCAPSQTQNIGGLLVDHLSRHGQCCMSSRTTSRTTRTRFSCPIPAHPALSQPRGRGPQRADGINMRATLTTSRCLRSANLKGSLSQFRNFHVQSSRIQGGCSCSSSRTVCAPKCLLFIGWVPARLHDHHHRRRREVEPQTPSFRRDEKYVAGRL